jgi:ABC-type antimicrobial peptide transport system permease subunit
MAVAEPNFLDLRERATSFEAVAQYSGGMETIKGGSEPVRARTLYVSADFFRSLGVAPALGRTFSPEESRAGGEPVAVVSHGFWQRQLAGKTELAGTILNINDLSYSVIGVMPAKFDFPQSTEVWVARELLPAQSSRSAHNWSVVARVKQPVALEAARAEASNIARQLQQENGKDMDGVDFALVPQQEYMVGSVRTVLVIILVAVAFLLLVACTNVANLLLARVTARQKEFAVRAALGATRRRLAQQFIAENILLVIPAGALGALISVWGLQSLIRLNQAALPRAAEIGVDLRALAFTLSLSLLIAVILGLVPVLRYSAEDLHGQLKEAGRGHSSHGASNRLRSALVVSQVALTLMLLAGAALLAKSFYTLLRTDPGFKPESAVVMGLSLPSYNDPDAFKHFMAAYKQIQETGKVPDRMPQSEGSRLHQEQMWMFYERLMERLSQVPGAIAVGGVSSLPMSGGGGNGTFFIDNNPANTGSAEYRVASSGYFEAMGIALLSGRTFDERDKPESPHAAVISKSLADKYWPGEDPIGKRIQFGNMDGDLRVLNIVGVVGDVRERGLDSNVAAAVYGNALQRPIHASLSVVMRARADASSLVPAMRQATRELNADLPMSFRTLEEIFSSSLDSRRFSLVIFAVFGAVALLLAVMGIYGVISYAVTQRTQEIGIRLALGASSRDILKLVVGRGMILALIGIGIGLGAAVALTRLMASLLYGVSATDPATFAAVALLLAAAALVATYIPARRATKVDPMVALRHE